VYEADMAPRQLLAKLADRLEEGQALDVAHRAADLHEHEVDPLPWIGQDEAFDLVRDVGNDLDGGAQIVAAPLLLQDGLVDLARGDVVAPGGVHPGEPLVVAQVQIGLGAVLGDEDFPVLIGTHRAGIDIQIGVELTQADLVATGLQERAKGGGGETFSQ